MATGNNGGQRNTRQQHCWRRRRKDKGRGGGVHCCWWMEVWESRAAEPEAARRRSSSLTHPQTTALCFLIDKSLAGTVLLQCLEGGRGGNALSVASCLTFLFAFVCGFSSHQAAGLDQFDLFFPPNLKRLLFSSFLMLETRQPHFTQPYFLCSF